jgi:hypothetical protein
MPLRIGTIVISCVPGWTYWPTRAERSPTAPSIGEVIAV